MCFNGRTLLLAATRSVPSAATEMDRIGTPSAGTSSCMHRFAVRSQILMLPFWSPDISSPCRSPRPSCSIRYSLSAPAPLAWPCRAIFYLVGMEGDGVDRRKVVVVALRPRRAQVPHFDGTVLAAGVHPLAVALKADRDDVAGVALVRRDLYKGPSPDSAHPCEGAQNQRARPFRAVRHAPHSGSGAPRRPQRCGRSGCLPPTHNWKDGQLSGVRGTRRVGPTPPALTDLQRQ